MFPIAHTDALALLILLATLEVFLGVDNIALMSVLTRKLSPNKKRIAAILGFGCTVIVRSAILIWLSKLMATNHVLINIGNEAIGWHAVILLSGGLFLLFKSLQDLSAHLKGIEHAYSGIVASNLIIALAQIITLDLIYSVDSVVAALAMANDWRIMVAAMLLAQVVMAMFAKPISNLLKRRPTLETVALSFLMLLGFISLIEASGQKVGEGYIFAAVGFALVVEWLNLRLIAPRQEPEGLSQLKLSAVDKEKGNRKRLA